MIRLGRTLLESLDEIPPKMVRIIARKTGQWRTPMTNGEIALKSGLSHKRVAAISKMMTWAHVTVAELDAFRSACGVTPKNLRDHRAYIKRTTNPNVTEKPMSHLDKREAKTRAVWRNAS